MKKFSSFFCLLFFLLFNSEIQAQITLAIGDFKNDSEGFYLDSWEKSIPEFLKSELSKADELIMVERQQLESVLQEQALSMTGLMDSATAQTVGKLLGAQYIISGKINQSGNWIRIDARIIQAATGQVKSASVKSKDERYLQEMVALLANNIRNKLTGKVDYNSRVVVHTYPTWYWLGATAALGAGSILVNSTYQDHLAGYHRAEALSDFDERYDTANQWHQARTVIISLTATAAVVTLYCWIRNLSPDEVLASTTYSEVNVVPALVLDRKDYLGAGIFICF